MVLALVSFAPVAAKKPAPPCDGQAATIVGTNGDDVLNGTAVKDVIVGLNGNDTINGDLGDDLICGGKGNDTLTGHGAMTGSSASREPTSPTAARSAAAPGPRTRATTGGNGKDELTDDADGAVSRR